MPSRLIGNGPIRTNDVHVGLLGDSWQLFCKPSTFGIINPGNGVEKVIDVILLEFRRFEIDIITDQQSEAAIGRIEILMATVAGRRPGTFSPRSWIQLPVVQRNLTGRIQQH